MDSRQKERVFEEFDPTIEWERDSAADMLKIYLPGFRKEQLKVQVTTNRLLRVSGERELGDNKGIKFRKEIPISPDHDTNQISAKFERGILLIKHPKIITPDPKPPQPAAEPPKPAAQPPKDAPKPPKPPQSMPQQPPHQEKPQQPPPQQQKPKQPPPQQQKPKQQPPLPKSPKPEVPKIVSDAAKTSKNEIPEKVEGKKSTSDEITDAGITSVVDANKKQQKMTGDSDSVRADNVVGNGDKVATGIGRSNFRQVLSEVVKELKNPKKLMESVITVLLIVILRLRAMIMKPIKYFTKSEN